MNLFSLTEVSKTLGDAPLFQHVTLGIDAGERIGFVGRNGSGKSTFLKLLSGELEPDGGVIGRNRSLTISTVEQHPSFTAEMSVAEFLFAGRRDAIAPDTEAGAAIVDAYRSCCRELGVPAPEVPMGRLSGGMLRKAALARGLAMGARFLTLDEPTNHLDLDTIEWLEAVLRDASFGFLLVTHDRRFLDAVCTAIMEIEGGRIAKYPGNYSVYLERSAERAEALERAEQRRGSILRRELEWLHRGPRARTGKDKARTERVRDLVDARVQKQAEMREFSSGHRRLGKKVLELHEIAKAYDGREVIRPFSYGFRRGERIGVIGPNGSGKTTFLGLASGRIAPDTGTVVKGERTVFGSFDQTADAVDGTRTVIEFIREHAERITLADGTTLAAEQFLERFLFPRSLQSLPVGRLSGGELRRLALVRLLAQAPNFLLLDEPTNDLDLDTIRLLEEYLADFSGCMLLVSHDRALLDRLTDYLFVFDGAGGISGFTGNYQDYRDARAEERAAAARLAQEARGTPQRRATPREAKRGLSFKEREEYERLMAEITQLEEESRQLESAFQRPALDPAERQRSGRRYREIAPLLQEKLARWEELAVRAEA